MKYFNNCMDKNHVRQTISAVDKEDGVMVVVVELLFVMTQVISICKPAVKKARLQD